MLTLCKSSKPWRRNQSERTHALAMLCDFCSHVVQVWWQLLQISASVACRQLGFQDGLFRDIRNPPANFNPSPPWLGRIECQRLEDSLADCGLIFGNTVHCGPTQQLICVSETSAIHPGHTAPQWPFCACSVSVTPRVDVAVIGLPSSVRSWSCFVVLVPGCFFDA